MKQIPSQTQTVVIGGGIAGCSVAYHLALMGQNVILLERKSLGSGTSYHAAGMVRELQATESMTWMSSYTNKLFAKLGAETGVDLHYRPVGSLYVTNTKDRLDEFKYAHTQSKSFGTESELITPDEAKRLWPLLNTTDLIGAFYMPNDALVNPYQATLALANAAEQQGAQLFEQTAAKQILHKNGKVYGVLTDQGELLCDDVVICGGAWSRDFAALSNVNVPLHACEHYYILTEAIEGTHAHLPAVRDFDARCYVRPSSGTYWDDEGQRLMCGFFEATAKPWGMTGIPEDFEFGELSEDWAHLKAVLDNVKHRIPAIKDAKIEKFFNGPESFTYDNSYLIGPASEVDSLYVVSGLCSRGIQAAGGAGKIIADWVVNKESTLGLDLNGVDIRRCAPFTANRKYLHDRAVEGLGLLFSLHYPYLQFESARPVKTSALHTELEKAGACFGELAGWERANFYTQLGESTHYEYSFGRQNWHDYAAREHLAVRNHVGISDLSAFAKYLVQGRDAVVVLNQMCGAQIDVAVGRIVYTQALNTQGGIEADWTIVRVATDAFWVISSAASQARDLAFINQGIKGTQATVTDITSAYTAIGIMGPDSRALLSSFSPIDFSNEAFPFFTSQMIDFGYARARANRLSFVGELGWEIFIPTEFALSAYKQLIAHAKSFNATHIGLYAINSLRLEKGYRHWGDDIAHTDTPLEAGLGFAIDWNKPTFNGRERLLKQKEAGLTKKMLNFKINSPDPLLYHNETIYRNGKKVGYITSGMFCYHENAAIGLGYVHTEQPESNAEILQGDYTIAILGEQYSATASVKPFYDPQNQRMK